jgi:hypothetical protein
MTIRNVPGPRLTRRPLTRVVLAAASGLVAVSLAAACSSNPSGTPGASSPAAAASTAASTLATVDAAPGIARPSAAASAQSADPAGSSPLAVLPPAAVPPVSHECTAALARGAGGNVSPLACPGGGASVSARAYYPAPGGGPGLPALGPGAAQAAVYPAICYGYTSVYKTRPIAGHARETAWAYYGRAVNAAALQAELVKRGCPAS